MSNEYSRQEHDAGQTFFPHVYESELEEIRSSRQKRGVATNGPLAHDLIGLAFSGGGIRSATFNLGVLQAFANDHLLSKIDYLSTVSGGGYIGSWLSSWAYRLRQQDPNVPEIAQVEEHLNSKPQNAGQDAEPPQVRFLRKYSNYLTPRLGLLSGDTLAFIATYLRNLLLNLAILISAIMAVLLIPRSIGLVFQHFTGAVSVEVCVDLAIVFLLCALWLVQRNMMDASKNVPVTPDSQKKSLKHLLRPQWVGTSAKNVFWFVALPLFASSLLLAFAMWDQVAPSDQAWWSWFAHWLNTPAWMIVLSAGAAYAVLWTLADWTQTRRSRRSVPVFWAFLAGSTGGSFLLLLSHIFSLWHRHPPGMWYLVTFGVPMTAAVFLLVGVIHLGLIGRTYGDLSREWWARLGGLILAIAICWSLVCAVTLFVPLLPPLLWRFFHESTPRWVPKLWKFLSALGITTAVAGWATATITGVFAAKSSQTGPTAHGKSSSSANYDLLARLAPPLFVTGLIMILSVFLSFPVMMGALKADSIVNRYWELLSSSHWWVVSGSAAALLFVSWLLGTRVDVNEFSLHNAYRNRLVRCYLGATHYDRQQQPFTGFDKSDDLYMQDLAGMAAPFHIVNTTLNVTKGKELALQSRKARSFVFTPLYSGFEDNDSQSGKPSACYQRTEDYAKQLDPSRHLDPSRQSPRPGVLLGGAMAISGAALSPNMGHYSRGSVSFLLTIFGVRLGWWVGNPRGQTNWESKNPRSSWKALFRELTGSADEEQSEVYLSDGGHFENLALYELVRRRCRLIIVGDASCDNSYACSDLTSAIEKCRVDFATKIDINFDDIVPSSTLVRGGKTIQLSSKPFAIGRIAYPEDQKPGILVYIKPSLNADLPQDLITYACLADSFPHQSTGDQYFDEAQFESYRSLGFACASAALKKIRDDLPRPQARGTAA